VLKLGRD
jgi:hypothetical protein